MRKYIIRFVAGVVIMAGAIIGVTETGSPHGVGGWAVWLVFLLLVLFVGAPIAASGINGYRQKRWQRY